jgi:hypothetical protein
MRLSKASPGCGSPRMVVPNLLRSGCGVPCGVRPEGGRIRASPLIPRSGRPSAARLWANRSPHPVYERSAALFPQPLRPRVAISSPGGDAPRDDREPAGQAARVGDGYSRRPPARPPRRKGPQPSPEGSQTCRRKKITSGHGRIRRAKAAGFRRRVALAWIAWASGMKAEVGFRLPLFGEPQNMSRTCSACGRAKRAKGTRLGVPLRSGDGPPQDAGRGHSLQGNRTPFHVRKDPQ